MRMRGPLDVINSRIGLGEEGGGGLGLVVILDIIWIIWIILII